MSKSVTLALRQDAAQDVVPRCKFVRWQAAAATAAATAAAAAVEVAVASFC